MINAFIYVFTGIVCVLIGMGYERYKAKNYILEFIRFIIKERPDAEHTPALVASSQALLEFYYKTPGLDKIIEDYQEHDSRGRKV